MSFPSFGTLPAIHTRKALLLLDFQNDFVRPSGALHVPNTSDFLDSLAPLTTAFRRNGDVVWVRSLQADRRSLIGLDAQELVVLDRPAKKASSDPGHIQSTTPPPPPSLDEEAFLSVDSPRCCCPHTPGAQFPAPVLAAIDSADTLVDKSDYSALQDQGLILSFRTRFVTEIYLCGTLSNVSVYATALDAVRLGFSVYVVEDCLGFRSFQRHEEAMRRMADILGANGTSVQELLEELDWQETDAIARKGDPQSARWVTPAGIETVMDELDVRRNRKAARDSPEGSGSGPGSGPQRTVQDLLADASDDEEGNLLELANLVRASGRHRRPEQHPSASPEKKSHARARRPRRQYDAKPDGKSEVKLDPGSRPSSRRPSAPKNSMPEVCRPGDRIGEGDSRILYELDLPPEAFEQIRDEVAWQKMYHLSGEVPRLVAVQGRPQPDGSIPIYRHPADESPPLLPFTRTVNEVRVFVERILGHPLNHVLIQLYRGGDDRISEHSDKTLDIARGSLICNVSLGCQRTMVLRTKSHETDGGSSSGRVTQRIPLPHESLFILGEQTNRRWLHGIRPDKRPEKEKSLDERAFGGQRISLTFRRIATFVNAQGDTIWGQGAVSKDPSQGRPVIHGDPAETERLIRAFGEENRSVEFDWEKVYGGGFDAVNFVTSSTATLALGTDDIANLRVRLALDENGVRYDIPDMTQTPSHAQPLFTASDGTEVSGDVNILTYLARTEAHSPPRPGVAALQGRDQLDEIEQLLASWDQYQAHDGTPENLTTCLGKWDKTLAGQAYLCGPALGIDDCALWPILREMVVQGVVSTKTHRNVAEYYQRVEKRSIVKKVLETYTFSQTYTQ